MLAAAYAAAAQSPATPQFEAAQIKPSQQGRGRAGNGEVTTNPGRLTATNVTLRNLISEAYDAPYYRIFGGPGWIDAAGYDVDAKTENRSTRDQFRLMLRTLLAERFKLAIHRETRELRVYALTPAKSGTKLRESKDGKSQPYGWFEGGLHRFQCDMPSFAILLSHLLNSPLVDDPGTPSISTGTPIPVLDKTGIKGVYDIRLDIKADASGDVFIAWQRALQEQAGLKLDAQKAPLEALVIDRAEKIAGEN